ncbi:MAG: hypothetical protein C4518_15470 [Desulfobacteraceae bacterium]|nr:MAG: hypothetical protein C4518_15470 [Desulfobacteraceae bacterium]
MIIIPREKPAVQDLNSYYLRIEKFLEHFQGSLGTGGVYFKSPTAEAVVFFDEDNLINGYYKDKKQELKETAALTKIIETATTDNYAVSVYYILPERVYYWANLSNAEKIYRDLSSEFTDLEGLIKKMESERITGFIDVRLNKGQGGGLLFVYNGEVIGGSSAKGEGELDRSVGYRDDLIERSRKFGGMFNVSKIELSKITPMAKPVVKPAPKAIPQPSAPVKKPPVKSSNPQRVLMMLQDLLALMESLVKANKRIKVDFETLLNKQFVKKVDQYDFLDPFAAEFRYSGGKVTFNGKASERELAASIVECVEDMAAHLSMTDVFRKYIAPWKKKYTDEIIDFNIEI